MNAKTNNAPRILPALSAEELLAATATKQSVLDALALAGSLTGKSNDSMIDAGKAILFASAAKTIVPADISEGYEGYLRAGSQTEHGGEVEINKATLMTGTSQLMTFYKLASRKASPEVIWKGMENTIKVINANKKTKVVGSNYATVLKCCRYMNDNDIAVLSDEQVIEIITPAVKTGDKVILALEAMRDTAKAKRDSKDMHMSEATAYFGAMYDSAVAQLGAYKAMCAAKLEKDNKPDNDSK